MNISRSVIVFVFVPILTMTGCRQDAANKMFLATATEAARAQGGSPCEQAYAGVVAGAALLRKHSGSGTNVTERLAFLARCSSLPPSVQPCVVTFLADPRQCRAAVDALDTPTRERLREVWR
jgi:hypothetical protein